MRSALCIQTTEATTASARAPYALAASAMSWTPNLGLVTAKRNFVRHDHITGGPGGTS